MTLPLLISLPHTGLTIPPEVSLTDSFTIDDNKASLSAEPSLPIFLDFDTQDPNLVVRKGSWGYITITAGDDVWSTENIGGTALRNVSVWDVEYPVLYKKVSAVTSIVDDQDPGLLHNASVIAHYKETSPGSGKFEYYQANKGANEG